MRMNRGSAASAQLLLAPQTVVAKTGPIGAGEKTAMATPPTMISAKATQTPSASSAKRRTSRPADKSSSGMFGALPIPTA